MAGSLEEFLSEKRQPAPGRVGRGPPSLEEFLGGVEESGPLAEEPPPATGRMLIGRREAPELLEGEETAPLMESLRSYPARAVAATAALPSDVEAMRLMERTAALRKRLEHYEQRASRYPEGDAFRQQYEERAKTARQLLVEEQTRLDLALSTSSSSRAHLKDVTPERESTLGQIGGILAESAPAALAGIGTFLATRNPVLAATVGAGGGSMQQAGATAVEALETGQPGDVAFRAGVRAGAYEFAGEFAGGKIIFSTANKLVGEAALSTAKKIFMGLGIGATAEGASELVTQLAQDIDSKLTWNPSLTWEDIRRNAALATGAGALGGAVFGSAATGAATLADRSRRASEDAKFDKIMAAEMQRQLDRAPSTERLVYESMRPSPEPLPTGIVSGAPYAGEPIPQPATLQVGRVTMEGQEVTPGALPLAPLTPPVGEQTMAAPVAAAPMLAPEPVIVRSVPEQLAAAIRTSPEEGLAHVADNAKTIESEKIRPVTVAQQLLRQGAITRENFKAFISGLSRLKVQEQVDAEESLATLDLQLKVIDERMRGALEVPYVPTEGDRRELVAVKKAQGTLDTILRDQAAELAKGVSAPVLERRVQRDVARLVAEMAGDVQLFRYLTAQTKGVTALIPRALVLQKILGQYTLDVEARLRSEPVAPGTRRPAESIGYQGFRLADNDYIKYASRGTLVGGHAFGLKAGEVGVSSDFDQRVARQMISLLTRWIQKIMPEASVFVVEETRPGFGGSQTFYSSERKIIVIKLNKSQLKPAPARGSIARAFPTSARTLTPQTVNTLVHEFGHGVTRLMYSEAPQHVKTALILAWQDHISNNLDKTLGTYLNDTRGAIWAEGSVPGQRETLRELFMRRFFEYAERGGESKMGEGNVGTPGDYTHIYWTNMDEWFAHNMERMLESDYAEMTAPVKTFVKQAYLKMRQLFAIAKEGRLPDQTFAQWITSHRLRAEARATEARIAELKRLSESLVPMQAEVTEIERLLAEGPQPATAPLKLQPRLPAWASGAMFVGLPEPVLNNINYEDSAVGQSIGGFFRGSGMNQQDASGFERDLDRFSWFKKATYTLINVARINPHIKELWNPAGFSDPATGQTTYGYIDYIIRWANERMLWISQADKTLRMWRKLPSKQRDLLARFMLEQTVAGTYENLADPGVRARYPLSPEAVALFQRIDNDYKQYITAVEETLVMEAQARLANNPVLTAEIRRIRDQFNDLRQRPYFPLSRFGKYTITVRAARDATISGQDYKAGDSLYFSTYDRVLERNYDYAKVARMYPGQDVQKSKLSETVRSFAGIPTPLIEALKTRLNLTPEQREELNNYLYEIAPGQAFVKHLIRRKNTPGFSWDAERAYANYFLHGSNHLARLKFRDLLSDAHKRIIATARSQGVEDATKRMEIANYVAGHLDFVMNPENDWAGIRGAIAVAYLGGMLKSAWVNLTQVPMVTYPELARQHGDAKAIKELARAYGDLLKMYRATRSLTQAEEQIIQKWINGLPMTPAEERFFQRWSGLDRQDRAALIRAMQEGFIDQSFAMELAGVAAGGWLSRFHTSDQASHYTREFAHALMVPFELAERMNRRVTFIAALRLARQMGVSENDAYLNARQVVYDTQYEYSRWNRPELLRGKKGIIFMFMQYVLNTLFFAGGGANKWYSAWRWWALMLYSVGLMGLPFAENAKDLAAWALSRANPNRHLNIEYELKKLLRPLAEALGTSPDLFLHGASRYGFGLLPFADLSGSMSMGRIIPGTDVLEARAGGMKWNDAMAKAVTEVGGATSALVMRMLKAVASNHPDTIRRVEQGMPFSLGQAMMTALRWYQEGGEETWNGARIVGFDPNDPWQMAEILGKGLFGLQPTAIAEGRPGPSGEKDPGQIGYDETRIRQDFAHFYAIRRQHLLEQLDFFRENHDTEGVAKTLDEIRDYNHTAPSSAKLQGGDIRRSLQQREKARQGVEQGRGTSRLERGIARDIAEERL